VQYTLPRRLEQAQFVAGLAQEILSADPEASLVVLGDLNDYPDSQPLQQLTALGLENLWLRSPYLQRYSYNYQGISQALDYNLLRVQLPLAFHGIQPVPINADYPDRWRQEAGSFYRSSDHDPQWVEIVAISQQIYLPVVAR
jgi:hypothetical protein